MLPRPMSSTFENIISSHNNVLISGISSIQNLFIFQELVEFVQEPCFLYFRNPDPTLIVNKQMVKLLDYSSLEEFYRNELNMDKLVSNKEIGKLVTAAQKMKKSKTSEFITCKIYRKDGTSLSSNVLLRPLIESEGLINGYFGTIFKNEKSSTYNIDKTLTHLFNDYGFDDEVILAMDFKGNILASNKKFYMIDFFADFSSNRINLFRSIDKQYHTLLSRRIQQLKNGVQTPLTEYKLAAVNGQTAHIEVYSKTMLYKNRKVIISMIRDISMRKEIEKELLYAVVQTEERERQRFAQDLHDELGPFLSGLKLYLHEFHEHNDDPKKRGMLIEYLTQMIDEAVEKIRTISSNLTPQNMIDIGLTASVNKMIEKLNKTGQIQIKMSTEGQEAGFEHALIITIYRIILELINNSIKHTQSKNILIKLLYDKKSIRLIYTDDGEGFDMDKQLALGKGIGLKSIMNRVDLYNGTCKFTRIQPKGIEFDLNFPFE
jgi:signal transduction histidine kinase